MVGKGKEAARKTWHPRTELRRHKFWVWARSVWQLQEYLMVHVWIMLCYYSSFETTMVQSATSWSRVAREWNTEESHIGLYSTVMDGYIRGFIMEEREIGAW